MGNIRTEIELAAPRERIWALVADFSLYSRWNPLFTHVEGSPGEGATVLLTVALPAIDPFTVPVTLEEIVPRSTIRWRHRYRVPALLTWEYRVSLEAAASVEQVRVVQHSRFTGLLAPLFHLGLGRMVHEGAVQLNGALKRWGERGGIRCLKC